MGMQIGGLASGMDIDELVGKLMDAERIPLDKMKQEQTTLEWKTDAFRDINTKLLELDKIVSDLKLSKSYKSKNAASSQEGAVTATATSGASAGSYKIEVEALASGEMRAGGEGTMAADKKFLSEKNETGIYKFYTYDEKGDKSEPYEVEIKDGDTIKDVIKKINTAGKGNVRASYDATSERVIMETTYTGKRNRGDDGEIIFNPNDDGDSLSDILNLTADPEEGKGQGHQVMDAKDAKFTYNGLTMTSKDNNYTINDITFEFNNVTSEPAKITISNDVDEAFDNIKNFVDKYNEIIDEMNASQREEKYRDFPPLTKEQEEEMSEREIEKWEEKAKSGILRGESSIRNGLVNLRQGTQAKVDTSGEYTLLSQIGITTTKNYLDGGKLEIDEAKLKEALRDNPDDVYKLFSNNSDGDDRGIINRFDDALDQTRSQIESKAGKSYHTPDSYSIGRQMKQLDKRIETFESRMEKVEQRYWKQFTAMEKAISNLNQQADYLFSQFGGGM